jgi:hypothetical protein
VTTEPEWEVNEREWLENHLGETKGRDAMLYEAERIVPLASEAEIGVVFGEENVIDGTQLMEYLRELPGAGYIRSSLIALVHVIGPSAIGEEYSVEMAQEIGAPQT